MRKLSLLFVFIVLVCLCLWAGFGGIFALNFAFALVSFLLIVAVVFYLQKRKIDSLIQNASKEELEAIAEAYKSKQERLEEEEEEFFNTLECDSNLTNPMESKNDLNTPKSSESKVSKRGFLRFFTTDLKQEKASQPPTTQEIPQIQKRKFWHNFSAVNVKTGAKMFFLPLRLFAYGFLVVGILILIKHQSFDTIAFFSGLVVANILIIAGIILKNHSI